MRIIQRSAALRLRRLLSRLSRVLRDSSYERAPRKMSRRRQYIMIIYKVLTRSVDSPYVRSGEEGAGGGGGRVCL